MTVTEIVEVSKSRSKVYIDYEFAFVLYKGELRQYHVRLGEELEEMDYRVIMEEVLPRRVKLRAMNLLKDKDYTEHQLRQKLKADWYSEQLIEIAVQYLASYHYIDDYRYAVNYILFHEASRSRRRIEQDLMRRGISREVLVQAWQEWEAAGGRQDEEKMIRQLLEKKHYDPERTDDREKRRLYASLLRKGYSSDRVSKVLECENLYKMY